MSDFKFCLVCVVLLVLCVDEGEVGKVWLVCFEGYWMYWDNFLLVLVVLVEIDGKMFIVCNVVWVEGCFVFIIGFMECDEILEQGIVCELKEEIDLDVEQIELIGVYEFMCKNELIIVYYVKVSGLIKLLLELLEYCLSEFVVLCFWLVGIGYVVVDWMCQCGLLV